MAIAVGTSAEHLTRTEAGDVHRRGRPVVRGRPREIVGLIGPNGAGKTTTLRIARRHPAPDLGRVRIDGHDLIADALEAKRRLAFMPDEPHLFEYLTVDEHLRLVARLYGVADFERRRGALIEELELKARSGRCRASCRAGCGRKW